MDDVNATPEAVDFQILREAENNDFISDNSEVLKQSSTAESLLTDLKENSMQEMPSNAMPKRGRGKGRGRGRGRSAASATSSNGRGRGRGRPKKDLLNSDKNGDDHSCLADPSLTTNGEAAHSPPKTHKHLGKFRYLSNLQNETASSRECSPTPGAKDNGAFSESSESATEKAKTLPRRGKSGRGRGRPRVDKSRNDSSNQDSDCQALVSSRGRRIIPKKSWDPETSPIVMKPVKLYSRRARKEPSSENTGSVTATVADDVVHVKQELVSQETGEAGTDNADVPSHEADSTAPAEMKTEKPVETRENDIATTDDDCVTEKQRELPTVEPKKLEEVVCSQEVDRTPDVPKILIEDLHRPPRSNHTRVPARSRVADDLKSVDHPAENESPCPSAASTPTYEESCPPVPKPVKVKSRWRRSSELEQATGFVFNSGSEHSNNNSPLTSPRNSLAALSPRPNFTAVKIPEVLPVQETVPAIDSPPTAPVPAAETEKEKLEREKNEKLELQEKLAIFEQIDENLYLMERKYSKESKRMVCDCSLTKEELARGELGCGEDCLNRLLMIECGSRCPLGDRCTNKRIQRRQYAKVEVFKTLNKGFGLRSTEDLQSGDFLIEYVGEVIDLREFRRRAKDYARDKNRHFYFMALKSDSIIDATQKGNISRFINHSCEPNAETQKWTVNGELRVGFFVRRTIRAGEEITFDYQYQRYGKEAQQCFCEAPNCRGWIGEDPEKENKKEKRDKKEKQKRSKSFGFREEIDDVDLDEEIEKLESSGVKNKFHTLSLCRLMVRADDVESRRSILGLWKKSDQACRRLFLDYHGLKLLWGWMVDTGTSGNSEEDIQLKLELLETLASLPVPNKTMLLDSKVWAAVEKWAEAPAEQPVVEPALKTEAADDAVDKQEPSGAPSADAETVSEEPAAGNADDEAVAISEDVCGEKEKAAALITAAAHRLLETWAVLKEVFRIPKKERIEKMKEHEREADKGYDEFVQKEKQVAEGRSLYSSYDRRPNNTKDSKDRRRMRDSPERDFRKHPRVEDDNMTKEERRRLFALKVAQQEEEQRLRQHDEQMWRHHVERCLALGMDPHITPVNADPSLFFPPAVSPGFWDPSTGTPWTPGMGIDGNVSMTPMSETSTGSLQQPPPAFPTPLLILPAGYDPTTMEPVILNFEASQFGPGGIPLVSGLTPAAFQGEEPENPELQTVPPEVLQALVVAPPPPPPPPPAVDVEYKLPPRWKEAVDSKGRIYYFHVRLRKAQWEPPVEEVVEPTFSTEESESEDTEPVITAEESRLRRKAKRRAMLCQEKIISPRSDFERSVDAQRYRELKERILRQKLARLKTRPLSEAEKVPSVVDRPRVKKRDKEKQRSMEAKRRQKHGEEKLKERQRLSKKIEKQQSIAAASAATVEQPAGTDGSAPVSQEPAQDNADVVSSSNLDVELNGFEDEDSDEEGGTREKLDVSSNAARKIKDAFRLKISSVIVQILNPYRRNDCKLGRITCTEDFKFLARKLTHFVLAKELKHCRNIEDLVVNDSVKHKAKDFVRKYMTKFGAVYRKGCDDEA